MPRKRPNIDLSQSIQPRTGDLEKLFAGEKDVEQAAGLQLLALRIDAILPDPDQPRNTFPEESLRELSNSIQQDGVIQPIEVTEIRPNQYKIVHGERRWRAAKMAGLETIPAVVRRRDYDEVTRFVRQLVENIQREDLNDVDRAAGLLRLRDLMQEELDRAREEDVPSDKPWAKKMTWAKVGERLGYSRQRIHQLINLLKLPEEIKDAVRTGDLSERDTRIYQGMKPSQQRALHRARMAGDISSTEAKKIARFLKDAPEYTVHRAIRVLRTPDEAVEEEDEPSFDSSFAAQETAVSSREEALLDPPQGGKLAAGAPMSIKRLDWMRHHLAHMPRQGLTADERKEVLRLLRLIQQDISSLLETLSAEEE